MQTLSPRILITGNQQSVQNRLPTRPQHPVPLPTLSAPGCSRSGEMNSDHQYSTDISAMFDPPCDIQVKDTHTFPSGFCGGSSPMFGSSRLIVRLDDLSFQPSITCKMRKKCSGSFTSLYGDFVGFLWKFFVNLLRFEYICGSFMDVLVYLWKFCGCFSVFVEVFVYLCKFLVNLWRFVEVLCVIVEVLCIFMEVFCEFVKFCGFFLCIYGCLVFDGRF